jgi:hypothetical protein
MRTSQICRLVLALLISFGFTACGTGKVGSTPVTPVVSLPAQSPPTTLTGNWFLAGSRVPAAYPVVSTSLSIQGNIVTGEAAFSTQCTSAGIFVGANSSVLAIKGIIANDGSFQAGTGTVGDAMLGTTSLTLTGNSPLPATPTVWTGTYSLRFTPGSSGSPCSLTQTAPLTATPIASVTGTYIGRPVGPVPPFGSGAIVSVQITQGTPTLVPQDNTSRYLIPLTANLTITNSSCAFSGSTAGVPGTSSISGDSFNIILTPGFPYGFLSATLNDPTATGFTGDLTSLANVNSCPGIALYNFTRQ